MSPTGGTAPEAQASAFPWDAAMALGLSVLRWCPRDFWAATPREIAAAAGLGSRHSGDALGRADFERLVAAHPDPETAR
ncbi:putative phage protein (TIGR02216 family) [Methylorubrum rhodinum]|uniref:Putative phage protein (TIGR02216 family) n=1 Tax=Methylorubrum rhodinum TaxID=29428 RepID=A0A840ZFQ9_9HYPH|nr:phage tail assembly chaperone [Methylorubrum rhodinum]MBB5756015.1 putative phage protein (TIGR02216 family) [Methylorubrum rhodinum]